MGDINYNGRLLNRRAQKCKRTISTSKEDDLLWRKKREQAWNISFHVPSEEIKLSKKTGYA